MRIVVISFYAVTNIGDKILTECVSKYLVEMGHTVKNVDINGRCIISEEDSEDVRLIKQRQSEQIRKDSKLFVEYINKELSLCNLVLFAGGAILDAKSEKVAENILTIVNLAREKNIPVGFNSVGFFGADLNNIKGRLLRKALLSSNVRWISVRERAIDMANMLKGEKSFSVCCDPAVWAKEFFDIKLPAATNKRGKIVGINLIYENAYNFSGTNHSDIRQLYYIIYNILTESGYECLFFINGPQLDIEFANCFMEQFHIDSECFLPFNTARNAKQYLSSLSQFSFVISSRLHTSICCYSLKIPSLCLPWDIKMNEFYKSIGRGNWILHENDVCRLSSIINDALTIKYDETQYNSYRHSVINFLNTILNQI